MKSLSKIKNQLNETWDNFTEGWNRLTRLSGNALTRFTNLIKTQDEKDHPQRFLQQWDKGVGWSLLPVDVYEDDNSIHINLEAPEFYPMILVSMLSVISCLGFFIIYAAW